MFFHSLSSHLSFLEIVHNSSYIRESCDNDTENIRDGGQETGKSALSTGGGEKKKKRRKKKKEKKRVRISQIPCRSAIHPPSFSLFLSSSATDLFFSSTSLPPFPPSHPSTAYFSTIFPARSISIVFGTSLSYLAVSPAVFTSFLETSVARPSSPRVRVTENESRYDGIFERLVNSIHGN